MCLFFLVGLWWGYLPLTSGTHIAIVQDED